MKTHTLTLQRQEFIKQLFSPEVMFNAAEAYRRAYPKCKSGYNAHGSRLIANNSIKKEIAKYRAKQAKKTEFTLDEAHKMYIEDRDFARKCRHSGPAVAATTGLCRLYGMDKDNHVGERTIIVIGPKSLPDKHLTKQIESEVVE